jgi:hypothetical protein
MEMDLEHMYKFCIKYCLEVNLYKHGSHSEFGCYAWQIWYRQNLYLTCNDLNWSIVIAHVHGSACQTLHFFSIKTITQN